MKYTNMKEGKAIVFAYYKNNKLIGYRADTMGTVNMSPKIYHYSGKQVETILSNIEYNVRNEGLIGELLGNDLIIEKEKEIHNLLQDKRAFEIRVLECPEKELEFNTKTAKWEVNHWDYPIEKMKIWLQVPETHVVIETHYFSMEGRLNLQ